MARPSFYHSPASPVGSPSVDPEDLNYEVSSEQLGVLNYRPHPRWRQGLAVGLAVFALQAARTALRGSAHFEALPKRPPVLAPVSSLNQLRSVEPILAHIDGAATLPMHASLGTPALPTLGAYLRSVPTIGAVIRSALSATGYLRLAYARFLERFILAHGLVHEAERLLRAIEPAFVLLSNDHSLLNRAMLHAAKSIGIPTGYVQHAAVTKGFPPLGFDVAFLDGLDALEKYDLPGSSGCTVFLTGMAKSDEARRRARPRDGVSVLGLALNPLDRPEAVIAFVTELRSLAPDLAIVARPHPSDARDWDALLPGLERSDPRTESPFAFLDRVDALVCGPSSIALEAALVGVLPLTADFDGRGVDHYGFVGSGLVRKVEDAGQALAVLKGHGGPPSEELLRRYSATVGTSYDGRSAELVAELVMEHVGGGIDTSRWHPVAGVRHVEAYELAA